MPRAPQILIALLLLLPLASWLTTTGGLPACCGGRSCAMAAHCPMAAGVTMGKAQCSMSAAPQLSLPTSFFPVMPLPRRVHGVPSALQVPRLTRSADGALQPGFAPLPFHPPCA